jgi:hypothetical protein
MVIEEPRTNLAQTIANNLEAAAIDPAAVLALGIDQVELAVPVVQAAPEALVAPAERVVQVALAALAVRVVLAAQGGQEALAEPAVQAARGAPAELVAQGVVLALGIGLAAELVVPENPVELGVPELETGPAVAPELALVQVAVALRTKSVITRPRRDRVAAPRVEDSAAAAETTREPVAAEAVRAWAVAE